MARIRVSKDPSGRIIVSFPYDALLVGKVKTIDGRRWHPAEKHWGFPDTDGMVEKILKVFGDEKVRYLGGDALIDLQQQPIGLGYQHPKGVSYIPGMSETYGQLK